jgi:hypothetical protein
MNERYLLDSAKWLRQPPECAAAEFESVAGELASELNHRMTVRPDLERLIGTGNQPMMEDNSRNFCRFMSAMFHAYEPEVLVRTALWVFRAYRAHGFRSMYWPANLDTFLEIARHRLTPETFSSVEPFFQWLIVHIPVFVRISDEQLTEPLGVLTVHESRDEL